MTLSNEKIATSPPYSEKKSKPVQLPEVLPVEPANEEVDLDTLNKIRDLLFGQQVQKHEQRLDQLGNRLEQEYADLRNQINQRLDLLETSLRAELKTLTKTLENNHEAQTSAVSDLQSEYQLGMSTVKAQVEQLEETFSQKHDELKALLEREVQELNTIDDTDRDNLANLFSELALNIRSSQ